MTANFIQTQQNTTKQAHKNPEHTKNNFHQLSTELNFYFFFFSKVKSDVNAKRSSFCSKKGSDTLYTHYLFMLSALFSLFYLKIITQHKGQSYVYD